MTKQTIELFNNLCDFSKEYTGLDIRMLNGIRKAPYVRIRASICVIMMRYRGTSSVDMARLFSIDHSSVIYYKNNHKGRHFSDDEYADVYDAITKYMISINSEKSKNDLVKVLGLIRETLSV